MFRFLPTRFTPAYRAYAWIAGGLLVAASLLPVACVVWLLQKTFLQERLAMQELQREAAERRLDDAEAAILEGFENRLYEAGEWFRKFGPIRDGRAELKIVSSGLADAVHQWRAPLVDTRGLFDDIAAREALVGVREQLGSSEEASVAATLLDTAIGNLRFRDGRNVGVMIATLAMEEAPTGSLAKEASVGYLERAVVGDTPLLSSQRMYLLRKYGDRFRSDDARLAARSARQLSEWRSVGEAANGMRSNRVMETVGDRFVLIDQAGDFALLYQRESVVALCQSILRGDDPRLKGVWVEAVESLGPGRVLPAPLEFIHYGVDDLPAMLSREGAGVGSGFYIWIIAIVLVLSLVSTGLIVLLVRRQLSAAQLKNDLVATVSHELKTPVASIRLLVDTLLDESKRASIDGREYLELVARENARLGRLIDNFLAFSRMERDGGAFQFEAVDPSRILDESAQAFRERFKGQPFELEAHCDNSVRNVSADVDGLKTALGNLLENALKYGGSDKRIVFRVSGSESGARFVVQDFGRGLARRDHKRIFGKFTQVQRDVAEQSGGVGLGLSIVSFIVGKHRGTVQVESELGHGSVFTITIPYA